MSLKSPRLFPPRPSFKTGAAMMVLLTVGNAALAGAALPDPLIDLPAATQKGVQTAVFAGGCFWGVEAVFRHVKGVSQAVSGYAGGTVKAPSYEQVSSGSTGHAESVRVAYDPAEVSYGQLLKVFFTVAHDPTQLNRQGPDSGTQYRSAIFFTSDDQRKVAEAYVAQLQAAHTFPKAIVTQLAPLAAFNEAEAYHQNYLALHPDQPYIVINDLPKLTQLQQQFPGLYR